MSHDYGEQQIAAIWVKAAMSSFLRELQKHDDIKVRPSGVWRINVDNMLFDVHWEPLRVMFVEPGSESQS
jgi:hypothetical protein